MKIGVVGCGMISDIYIQNMLQRFHLDVKGCAATTLKSATKKAEKYGILAMTVDEMINDPKIDLIVNLTPPSAHASIIRKALLAGKHVYTEKCLTERLEDAKELIDLAKEKNLYFGCAPETFLGNATQVAKEMIDAGELGEITGFHAMLNINVDLMYDHFPFLVEPAAGIGLDRGVYFLTQICYLLGNVKEVQGFSRIMNPHRKVNGKETDILGENQMVGIMRLENGALGTVNFNGNTVFPEISYLEIYGKKGILKVPDANLFGGEMKFFHNISDEINAEWETLPIEKTESENLRGIGVAKMIEAIEKGLPNPIDASRGYHVMETIMKMIEL